MSYPTAEDIIVSKSHTNTDYLNLFRGLVPKGRMWNFDHIDLDEEEEAA